MPDEELDPTAWAKKEEIDAARETLDQWEHAYDWAKAKSKVAHIVHDGKQENAEAWAESVVLAKQTMDTSDAWVLIAAERLAAAKLTWEKLTA